MASEPRNRNTNSIIAVLIIVTVLIVGGVLFFGSQNEELNEMASESTTENTGMMNENDVMTNDSMTNDTSMLADDSMNESDTMTDEEVRVIEVEGGSFYFDPEIITINAGEPVKVVLNSVDMMHDFVVEGLEVRTEIAQAGETVEVEFTVDEPGEYVFYCSVGQHRANGMVGTLVVR